MEHSGVGDARTYPAQIAGDANYVSVVTGHVHTIALDSNEDVWCFGSYSTGGFELQKGVPTIVPHLKSIQKISSGTYHVLALDLDGFVFAWASEGPDLGESNYKTLPAQITGLEPIVDICCRGFFNLLLDCHNQAWAFGVNAYGQLGLGDTNRRQSPESVHCYKYKENLVWIFSFIYRRL
jgi:alpha-tubulin suppressor-like RCC1 family protein